MTDPLTGRDVDAQLGSDRRLRTIYNVNLRSAYQKAQYERTMSSELHPYLMYRVGNSQKHREQHLSWDGLILPKDDPTRSGIITFRLTDTGASALPVQLRKLENNAMKERA